MPSPYSPPDVHVEQHQRTRTATRITPQLPVVVVGPARQIITRESAGTYEAGEEFQARLPDLASGATVDANSLEVLLQAVDDSGKSLGLFQLNLNSPADAELLADGETLRIYDTLALEYSSLSSRNNNQPDSITDDDSATGTPDTVWFTDEQVDFLSRGATVDGSSFLVISSPASMAGRYRILELVPSGTNVYTVKVLKVDEDNVAELQKDTEIDASALPSSRYVYGFDADHFLGTVAGGSNTSNVVLGTSEGVGVDALVEISTGKSNLDNTDLAAIVAQGAISLPDQLSGDAVWLSPGDPGDPATLEGINTVAWRDMLQAAAVGDWLRFEGDWGGATNEIRDFKITAIDTTDWEIQVQNSDLGGTGTFSLDAAGVTGGDVATIKVLRVVRGKVDAANAAGDVLTGTSEGVPFTVEILKATPAYIELAADLPTLSGVTNTDAEIIRGIPFRNATATYDITRRISSGFTGDVLVSYQADRTDLSTLGLIDLASQEEIEDQIGVIHPDNPLALMCDMVTRSGITDGNRVFYALATDGDTQADFQAALDTLTTEDVYYIVPATNDEDILQLFAAHVASQSEPSNKHERMLIGSTERRLVDAIIPVTSEEAAPQGDVSDTVTNRITTASPTTIDWGTVKPGMVVKVLASSDVNASVIEEHRIKDVNSALGYAEMLDDFGASLQGTTVYFKVDSYPRTKLEQAEYWRDEAKGFASKRVVLVRPDAVTITYTDKTGAKNIDRTVQVPGYYAAAAVCGMKARLAAQQPITNVPVPGISSLVHSNDYFTPDQLNTIAEGGNAILVQDNRGTAPYLRHQLTTAVDFLETREWSITTAVDYAAKIFRRTYRSFIGKHNITSELLTQLRGIGEGIVRRLIGENVMLQGTTLTNLYQNPDQLDSVIVEVSLNVPYPCNNITVKLYI